MMSEKYLTRERMLHEKVFDTLSRPLSRATGTDDDSSTMFSGKKIKWNHFGKKHTLRISDYEMEYVDLYDALMKKVHEVRPDFEGALAYIDNYGRQVIISNDKAVRDALAQQAKKGLKIHTTLPEGGVISAAEIAGRPTRSQSVPPERNYNTYPSLQSRSPSSMESAPAATYRPRAASPPPTVNHYNTKTHSVVGSYAYTIPAYKYGPGYGPYSQSILYGMPPHNGMLLRFLANPFPFGNYHRTFVGPNKYHHFGGWGGRYYSGFGMGMGPVF